MKDGLHAAICGALRERLDRLTKAAREAHAAATDASSKAESKYDTRNLEQSYLATGQARQVLELTEQLRILESVGLAAYDASEGIAMGTLVKAICHGETQWFALVPAAGGLEINHEQVEVVLLSPQSMLGQKLIGRRPGDRIESPTMDLVAAY